jgi:hypothetical protein
MSDCYSYSAIIRNKLYIHSGLYICFVQNITILHCNMIQFHKYEIKSPASHSTVIIKTLPNSLKASVVQLTMPVSSAQNWNKSSANHHADLKTVTVFPFSL